MPRDVLWIKKKGADGQVHWYPKRTYARGATPLDVTKAKIEYGWQDHCILPYGVKPKEEWLGRPRGDGLFRLLVSSRDGNNRQVVADQLRREDAEKLQSDLTKSPLASGLKVWIEEV